MKKLIFVITALLVLISSVDCKPKKGEGIVAPIVIDTSMTMEWEGYSLGRDSNQLYSDGSWFEVSKEEYEIALQFTEYESEILHPFQTCKVINRYTKYGYYKVYLLSLFGPETTNYAFETCSMNPYRCMLMEALSASRETQLQGWGERAEAWQRDRILLVSMLADYIDNN